MSRNVVEVYEDQANLLQRFNERLGTPEHKDLGLEKKDFYYFDSSELGSPIVVDDNLARTWLEINYLFSTGFRPNRRYGIGEIGADIKDVEETGGEKHLTIHVGLLDATVKALNDFRDVEEGYAEFVDNQERYMERISELSERVRSLSGRHSPLEDFEEMFGNVNGSIGLDFVKLPSEEFVGGLEKLSVALRILLEVEDAEEAIRLNRELKRYSSLIPELKKIRKYHKATPCVSKDGMIRINSPAASGGLSMHTHPGHNDPYNALPSGADLMLIAAQSGALPGMVHVGAGSTKGEHYIMHIPRKIFFDEVKTIVDKEGINNEEAIGKVKQGVLDRRLDDIMANEILGFKADGTNSNRVVVLSPIVTAAEYGKNRGYFRSRKMNGIPFGVEKVILDLGEAYIRYTQENKEVLIRCIGTLTK